MPRVMLTCLLALLVVVLSGASDDQVKQVDSRWTIQECPTGFVTILGDVGRPGDYTLPKDGTLTLRQLIASVGGVKGDNNKAQITVRRPIDNTSLNYLSITLGDLPTDDLEPVDLQPNDSIHVLTMDE